MTEQHNITHVASVFPSGFITSICPVVEVALGYSGIVRHVNDQSKHTERDATSWEQPVAYESVWRAQEARQTRSGCGSISTTATGVRIGQTTFEKDEENECQKRRDGALRAFGQAQPQQPLDALLDSKKSGIVASGISERACVLVAAAIPAAPVKTAAAKLAEAEKHIGVAIR